MVSPFPRRGHAGNRGDPGGSRPRRVLLRVILAGSLSFGLLLVVVLGLLPALGRRGDLNAIVEGIIRSSLAANVKVEIGSIETDPLSEFSLTRVSSLSAEAESRFQFQCDRITAFYRPLELVLDRRVRELTAHAPSLYLDLDRDLSNIVAPGGGGGEGGGFRIDRFRIFDGRFAVRVGGRDLVLEGLEIDAAGMGGAGDIIFRMAARMGGARFSARGHLTRLAPKEDGQARYRVETAEVEIDDLDLAPALAFLPAPLLEGAGLLSLSGSAEGIWPEKVELRLGSKLRGVSARPTEAAEVSGGEAHLEIDAIARGELDHVDFHIRFEGAAELGGAAKLRQEILLDTRGRFEKRPAEGTGGRVWIEQADVEVPGLGAAEVSGFMGVEPPDPELSFDFRFPRLALRRLADHPLATPLAWALRRLEGELEASGRLEGTFNDPQLALEWRLDGAALRVAEAITLRGALTASARKLKLSGGRIEAAGVRIAASEVQADGLPAGVVLRGNVEVALELDELVLPPERLAGRLEIKARDAAVSVPAHDLDAPSFEAHASVGFSGDLVEGLRMEIDATASAPEVAWGRVVETFGEEPLHVAGQVTFVAASIPPRADLDLRLDAPSTGVVLVRGAARAEPGSAVGLDVEIEAPALRGPRLFAIWVRDPLKARFPFLEGATFTGAPSISATVRGPVSRPAVEGIVKAQGLGLDTSRARLENVSLELPFRMHPPGGEALPETRGRLGIGRLTAGKSLDVRELAIPFSLIGEAYRLDAGGLEVPLFGGKLAVERLEVLPAAGEGERLRLVLSLRDVRLAELLSEVGLPAINGRANLEARNLSFRPDRLAVDGGLVLEVFGGRVEMVGLSIDHPLAPYRIYSLANGSVRDLDLGRLGKELRFGVASGILEGRVKDVVLTSSDIVGFEVAFETVPRPGVPQFLDKTAIESIQRVFVRPFRTLEELFFSRFRYAEFGFRARLQNGRLRVEGKRRKGDVEYLMYSRWYQFPRVEIVNTRPGIDYDWATIWENMKSVYRRSANKEVSKP